jgi:mannose-6-phosphate isomerase-like protein (cupin superfamily)
MQILNLEKGVWFQMGKGQNWRVVHPDMGAKQITLNHSLHAPGHEFTQHTHGESEDVFVILEGGASVRQGDVLTPVTAGDAVFVPSDEVHGTVNTTDGEARLISFQSPPDMALYRGERDRSPDATPKPQVGHRSAVQITTMTKGGPVFGKPGNWRSVVSAERGAKHLALDYIQLGTSEGFEHKPGRTEEIYVLTAGKAEVTAGSDHWTLEPHDVIFLSPGDAFSLSQSGDEPVTLIHCWAQA